MDQGDLVILSKVRALTRSGAARSIRLGAGLTMGEFAEALGCSRTSILRWETGERTPRGPLGVEYGRLLERLMRPAGRG